MEAIRNARATGYEHGEHDGRVGRNESRGRDAAGGARATTRQTLDAVAPYGSFDFGAVIAPPAPAELNRYIENHKVATHRATVTAGTAEDHARGEAVRAHLAEYTMRTPGGVEYAVPFRMARGPKEVAEANRALVKALGGDGVPEARHAPMVVLGRATSRQLREVCEALQRRYPGEFANAENARGFLRRMRVGVDCAGFVQNTLSSLTGTTPPLGLREKGMEDLSRLASNPSFRARTSPTQARPGDVITLKPTGSAVGHTLVVIERVEVPGGDLRGGDFEIRPDDTLTILSVAASWGGRGPQEQDWVYNPRTDRWGTRAGNVVVASDNPRGPYDHELGSIWAPKWR